jgi:DNA-binding LacI/PurR family transcriptional regulator
MDHRGKNVTLRDVAQYVGLSAMTVSRALSEKSHLVSPETAKRCREAAEHLGYIPNLMARGLRGEQLRTIVMFAEYISSHHYLAELVDHVSRAIEARSYGVISCQSLKSFHQALRNFRLGGAVVIAPPEDFYKNPFGERAGRPVRREPLVLIHSAVEQTVFPEVSPDISSFCYQAACHLLELGHRHIAYLGGPRAEQEPQWFQLGRRGLVRAMEQYRAPLANLTHQACADAGQAPGALRQLMNLKPETTALICHNDEIAIATASGAKEQGHRVPETLSIIGCNDIKLAEFFRPKLTTVKIDIPGMVNTALDMLFDEMDVSKPKVKPIQIHFPANLVLRDSTAPPRKQG